jgi:uncharacterized protein with von Willebrand factor type A (vWA) domain
MDPKDLLRLLDLDGKPPDPPPGPSVVTAADSPPPPAAGASPTAMAVDAWGLRRGRELVAESDRLRKAGTDEFAAADFFASAFDPDPRLVEACADPRRHEFLAQLLDTPEYRSLHAATRLDDTAAGIAAAHFAEQFARLRKEEDDPPPAAGGATDPVAGEMATLRAVGRALAEAGKEVGEMREAAAALGLGPGTPGASDPRAVAALFKRVRADPGLRRVCDLAGRFRRVAQSRQRMKAAHGYDDVVGVTTGGDVGRLLSTELARLAVPELELETLRRVAERAALCREHRAVEPAGRGPVIAVVDESGSMHGAKVETAKALALALAWVARRQRRWVGLCAYSGDSGERLLALPPGRWDEHKLADWLAAFLGRGSTLDLPIRELPDYYRRLGAPPGVTDVVFVTDALCRIPADLAARFTAWKRSVRARVISLVIGSDPGDLALVSDEYHRVAALSPDDPAVGRALAL